MYYHRVYFDVFQQVSLVYSHLLHKEEVELIELVLKLEKNYQLLLFRLLNRSRNWIRSDRLEYDEINFDEIDLKCPPNEIFEVDPTAKEPWIDRLKLDELRALATETGYCTVAESKKKHVDELVLLLNSSRSSKQARICFDGGFSANRSKMVDMVSIINTKFKFSLIRVGQKLCEFHDNVVLPLYFINSSDPAEELRGAFLAQVDQRRYPAYHITRSGSIFDSREEFELYQESLLYYNSLDGIPDSKSLLETSSALLESFRWHLENHQQKSKGYYLQRFSVLWTFAKALEYIATCLESMKEHEKAVDIYRELLEQELVCLGRRGDWWERLILDSHKHLKCSEELVRELCQVALEDVHVRTGSRWAINKRLNKLSEACESQSDSLEDLVVDVIEKEPVDANSKKGQSVMYYFDDKEDVVIGVEDLAIRHYQAQGWDGVHSESGLFTMLFAIVFWDVLFCSLPDVFQTPYQIFPLDLRTDAFYESRKDIIEERLADIESGSYDSAKLSNSYHAHERVLCVGVNWDSYSVDFLANVFEGLGPKACSVILRALAMDYRNYSSGMPDLVLWRDGEVMLAEVKSENDKLSDQQRNWLSILLSNNVSVRLCKISRKKNK